MTFICGTSFAVDRYVPLTGTNDSGHGYANGSGAATTIQWAVDACDGTGAPVWVTHGTCYLTHTVAVGNITLRRVNGRDVTTINGNYPFYTNGCLYINNPGAVERSSG